MAKSKKADKAPTKAELKAKETAKLEAAEASMIEKHGDKIVPGSVRRETTGKISVEIRTRGLDGDFDGNTRRVATSDVHQVSHMPEVVRELRKLRSAEKRAARKPAKAPKAKASKGKGRTRKSRKAKTAA